ncbi:MAG: glycosyltransferase [bacterium]
MKICYFGNYLPDYIRNRVIIKGLKENKVDLIECHTKEIGLKKYFDLLKMHKDISGKYDLMIIGSHDASRLLVALAKFLTKKPIVWDAHYSIYDSWVYDRKLISPKSFKAKYYWFLDWLGCTSADKILLDTDEHIQYFVDTFKIKKEKFIRVLVGADDKMFFPKAGNNTGGKFIIEFHGKYIPLQGIEYIIEAAKILEKDNDIIFNIIGKGQTYAKIMELSRDLDVRNINFIDRVPYEEIPDYISQASVCFGIFGNTKKTLRVIPNKIYESMAMAKAIITADTPAIKELFVNRENILFCKVADGKSLAEKILELKNNQELRDKIAKGAYKLFKERCTPRLLAAELLVEIKKHGK